MLYEELQGSSNLLCVWVRFSSELPVVYVTLLTVLIFQVFHALRCGLYIAQPILVMTCVVRTKGVTQSRQYL
jgi:hypothetical protein